MIAEPQVPLSAGVLLVVAHAAIGAPIGYLLWKDLGWKPWIGGVLGAIFGPGIFVVWLFRKLPEFRRDAKAMGQSIRDSRSADRR